MQPEMRARAHACRVPPLQIIIVILRYTSSLKYYVLQRNAEHCNFKYVRSFSCQNNRTCTRLVAAIPLDDLCAARIPYFMAKLPNDIILQLFHDSPKKYRISILK